MSEQAKKAAEDVAKEVILAFLRAQRRGDEYVYIHESEFEDAAECTNLDECAAIIDSHFAQDAEKMAEHILAGNEYPADDGFFDTPAYVISQYQECDEENAVECRQAALAILAAAIRSCPTYRGGGWTDDALFEAARAAEGICYLNHDESDADGNLANEKKYKERVAREFAAILDKCSPTYRGLDVEGLAEWLMDRERTYREVHHEQEESVLSVAYWRGECCREDADVRAVFTAAITSYLKEHGHE